MRNIQDHAFDVVWAQGFLVHILPQDLNKVLEGIERVTTKQAVVYIGVKDGEGTALVNEQKLSKPLRREFKLWRKESFMQQVGKFGWRLIDYAQVDGFQFRGIATLWHKFIFSRE